MSNSYTTVQGDTFESIARKKYGDDKQSSLIQRANPGLAEPLAVGTTITIPPLPGAPLDKLQSVATDNPDEIAILIGDDRYRYWDRIKIVRSMDTFDRVVFESPFEADKPYFREAFRPFTYKDIVTTLGGEPLFTGMALLPVPTLSAGEKRVKLSCYGTPGPVNDCTPPASAFPLEFNNQGLKTIAETLLKPFGISVQFDADQGATFSKVAIEPGKYIFPFLIELAKQRNLVIGNTPRGAILFRQSVETGSPVAILEQGASPVVSVEPSFDPQKYYSSITGIDPTAVGSKGSQFTVKNPHLSSTVRPFTFKAKDTNNGTIQAAVEARAARMFAEAASYIVQVDTWRDPSGNLWEPNTSVILEAPGAFVYNPYEFIIRTVELEADRDSRTATLTLVMPGVFSGQIPEALPWDE